MAVFKVPLDFSLPGAVEAAAANADEQNFIDIGPTPIHTGAAVVFGIAFDSQHQLTVRPDPAAPGLTRAVIINSNPGENIFRADQAGYVLFQDLDILRNATNNNDLVQLNDCVMVTVERCRIGSMWTTTGSEGWSNLLIKDPIGVTIRNCILFAHRSRTFTYGLRLMNNTGFSHLLRLYNNVVADYREYGIHATGPEGDALLLLRNNVAVNDPNSDPEAVAYYSAMDENMTVVTSHNTAFAGLGLSETIAVGCQSIAGEAAAGFIRHAPADAQDAFVQTVWSIDPPGHRNPDFFRLVPGGPLHDEPHDAGQTVDAGVPHARDAAVTDDIEKDVRPAGFPLHTDRGADQIRDGDLLLNLDSLTLNPLVLPGCKICVATVTLNGPAGDLGAEIKIAANDTSAVVPPKVTVPPGATSASLKIRTMPVSRSKKVRVEASYHSVTRNQSLTIRPIGLQSLKLSAVAVSGGNNVNGAVDLECKAEPAPIEITLKSSSALVVVPRSLTIPRGERTGTFVVRTKRVNRPKSVVIRATANSVTVKVILRLRE